MEKRIFIRFWIIIAGTTTLVVFFIVGWILSLRATESEVFERYNQQQSFLVNGTASGIEGLFEDLAAALISLGSQPEIQSGDGDSARIGLGRKLAELAPLGIADIGFLDSDGTARAFAVEKELEGIDYSWRSFFKEAQAASIEGKPNQLIIELQYLNTGELGFRIAVPIYKESIDPDQQESGSVFSGVILGILSFDTLVERHLAPFKPPGGGHIFLVNADYDLLWSSDKAQGRVNLLGHNQVPVLEMIHQMGNWTGESAEGGAYTYRDPTRSRETELVAYAPVRIGKDLMAVAVRTPGGVARQTALSTSQSQQLVFILSLATLLLGVLLGAVVLRRETRRRMQVEEALRQSVTDQAILAERNRLASDLHDSVTQGLYGILLHADAAMGQLSEGDSIRAKTYLEEIKAAGKEGLAEMRLLIFELRPPVLEEEGLVAALETRLYAVEKRAGLGVELISDIGDEMPRAVEIGLYRIAQEGLNNVLKHAQAEHVRVCLQQDGKRVSLEIQDDGCGFDTQNYRDGGGMGLSGMGARVRDLGGRIEIGSSPGNGTRIFVEVSG